MNTVHRIVLAAAALAASLAGLMASPERAEALLYDLDFGTPPHTIGLPPVIGAGPAVRKTVSQIPWGTPTVVASHGPLVSQPCLFDASDDAGDQIRCDLDDLPPSDRYYLESDLVVTSADPTAHLTFTFDAPGVRNIMFRGDGSVLIFVTGFSEIPIGTFTIGSIVHLEVAVDLDADTWTISLDGDPIYDGTFGSASSIIDARVSTDVIVNPPSLIGAIDNLVISENPLGSGEPCDRLTFGDLVTGTQYAVGSSFLTDGVLLSVGPHSLDVGSCGAPTANGFVQVDNDRAACGLGKELDLNNADVSFDFPGPVTDVVIPYGEYGGTVALSVNGDCQVVENLADLDGTQLGGVTVTVFDFGVPGQSCGVIRLGGTVDDLAIGGQEFFIDGLSYCEECLSLHRSAFDDQTIGSSFGVGDRFTSGGATHTFSGFYPPGSGCTNANPNGVATIDANVEACGNGRELSLNNINDKIIFDSTVDWLVLNYGEFGGNVNLRINGDCRNVDNFSDLNGTIVGGVDVWAIDYGVAGQSCGILVAVGSITDFRIGGQELWIDNVHVCGDETAGVTSLVKGDASASMLRLEPARPNPTRGASVLSFALARPGRVRLTIYDVAGRMVRTLMDGEASAGAHEVAWDGRDGNGRRLPAGVYTYRAATGSSAQARTIILLD